MYPIHKSIFISSAAGALRKGWTNVGMNGFTLVRKNGAAHQFLGDIPSNAGIKSICFEYRWYSHKPLVILISQRKKVDLHLSNNLNQWFRTTNMSGSPLGFSQCLEKELREVSKWGKHVVRVSCPENIKVGSLHILSREDFKFWHVCALSSEHLLTESEGRVRQSG